MKNILLLSIACICLTGCQVESPRQYHERMKDEFNGTKVADSGTLYIVEKDGYKFAIFAGSQKGGIIQIDESKKALFQTK